MTPPRQHSDQMLSRITVPDSPAVAKSAAPPFRIVIPAADGTELLVMTEVNGMLSVTGDESRWDEGAKRFLYGMMQWSGQVGIRWKDEVAKAASDR